MKLLAFGALKGYRTYILAALAVLTAGLSYLTGDQSGPDTLNAIWQAVMGLGLGTLRAGVQAGTAPLTDLLDAADPDAPGGIIDLDDRAFTEAIGALKQVQAWRDDPVAVPFPRDLHDRIEALLTLYDQP